MHSAVKLLQKTLWGKNRCFRGGLYPARFRSPSPWWCCDAGWARPTAFHWCGCGTTRRLSWGPFRIYPNFVYSVCVYLYLYLYALFLIYAVCMHIESGHGPQGSCAPLVTKGVTSCSGGAPLALPAVGLNLNLPKSPNALITPICRKKYADIQILLCSSSK